VKPIVPALILLPCMLAFPASAQISSRTIPQADRDQGQHPEPDDIRRERDMQKQQLRELNRQRQEQMKRDTDKLLQLATELKQYVDKTNENILSVDVLKKADEIERLAKSVKDKMRATYAPTP